MTELTTLASCIDLTTLNSLDTAENVENLIKKIHPDCPPAAICIFPSLADGVRETLRSDVRLAVVGGNFPCGQLSPKEKGIEVLRIGQLELDEIDVVIQRGNAARGNYDKVQEEVNFMKAAAGDRLLKVILETGELMDSEVIRETARAAIRGGADFIKTSTGKSSVGATPDAVEVMCEVIKEYYTETGNKIGIKPSGGIRTPEDAIRYYKIVNSILGEEWLTPSLFRIGASSLYTHLISAIDKWSD